MRHKYGRQTWAIRMAVEGLSERQKANLAEIVTSETLFDIEEYIRPEFPSKLGSREILPSNVHLNSSRRRIVQDGHGRWREIKPQHYSSSLQPSIRKNSGIVKREGRSDLKHGVAEISYDMHTNKSNYNNLSMALRSNIFPGLGNNSWHTTTAKVYKTQPVIPPSHREKFFGVQTDEFGKWSAANVRHERMKKKWNTYLDSLPKQAANWPPQELKQVTPKVEKPPPQAKLKKPNPKPRAQKKQTPVDEEKVPLEESLPSKPIDIIQDEDNNANFWDFYDKPFNKPT